jgi:hypothetical protein
LPGVEWRASSLATQGKWCEPDWGQLVEIPVNPGFFVRFI